MYRETLQALLTKDTEMHSARIATEYLLKSLEFATEIAIPVA